MVNVPIIDMAATGKRIAALRDAAGLTVRDLQDILDSQIHRQFISGSMELHCPH